MAARLAGTAYEGRTDEVFEEWFDYNSLVNADILDLADRLRQAGHPVALATNQEKYRMEYLLDTLGLGEWFDAAYPSYEIGFKKPDARYFQGVNHAVFEKFGARQIYFVDDAAANIDAGFAADWKSYLYDERAPGAIEKLEKSFAAYLPKES